MRLHIFGPSPLLNVTPEMSIEHCFIAVGGNTGNLLFVNALMRQIECSEVTFGYEIDPGDINRNVGLIVIPAANWLQASFADAAAVWRKRLAETTPPLLLVGLGAQASSYDEIPEVPPSTISFLKLILERSSLIGTRGEFTTSILEKYGFKDVATVGCPSLYYHQLAEFPEIRRAESVRASHMVLQGTRHRVPPPPYYETSPGSEERRLYKLALHWRCNFIFQSEFEEMHFVLGRGAPWHLSSAEIEALVSYYGVSSLEDLADFLLDHVFSSTSKSGWRF